MDTPGGSGAGQLASGFAVAAALTISGGLQQPVEAQQSVDGQQVYSTAGCQGCHGQNGNGGIGIKFRGNQILADDSKVIAQILHGGSKMPAFSSQLSDAQIAAVASYIRQNFDNSFGPITAQKVADMRKSNSSGDNQQASQSENPSNGQAQASGNSGSGGQNGNDQKPQQMAVGAPAQNVKQPTTSGPDQAALDNADSATDSWLMYNKGYSGQRWSSLDQINAGNADQLRPVCIAQLGEQTSFQSSPVVYDGLVYVTTPYTTYAVNAENCRQVWHQTYTPKGNEPFNTNRGIAIAGGRVFRGTSDGHVIAMDAKTGDVLWNIRPVDSGKGYFLSSAPIVWHDMLFMGTAGADWGAPAHMFAFDVKDGHQLWSFDEVVQASFGGADPASTGGGSNWTSYSLDTKNGLLYVPVGNPAPDFAARYRPGDNLYSDSTLVLDAKTGKLDHYYQQIPNDALDRDSAAAPVIFSLTDSGGNKTVYAAQSSKNGYVYVYNEANKQQVFKSAVTTLKNAGSPPTTDGTHVCPGINGGVEWYGPAFDKADKALVVPSVDWCTTFTLGEVRYTPGQFFFAGSYSFDPVDQAQGWIHSISAADGKTNWSYKSDLPVVAGVTPTAGGVVFAGELNGDFTVLNAKTGDKLYSFNTGGPIGGGISTYEMNGQQYVAVASGNMSRTWSPDVSPSATLILFGLGQGQANQ
ncbi:PQQ-binding-like beta-propeller repeat protein [Limimaricola sp.]|uniref:outer membrane protein assembly factor BamB family protein n=1 Tax=Limimaricola sp. TaxID=2211665 RepID=UPI0025BA0E18|nr:PQQ-binding-like beta-propeller repeat protein [Limimaricola sp.]